MPASRTGRVAAEAARAEVEATEEQVIIAEARARLAKEARPDCTNWLLVIGAAMVAFVVSAGLIWAYGDDVRKGKSAK